MVTATVAPDEQTINVWDNRLVMHVKVLGTGTPLFYFHPAAGLAWDPFLVELSKTHTIYAPEVPGTSNGDAQAIHEVDTLWDLILIYEEVIRSLDFPTPPMAVGQSFGGMLAAELAAHFPTLFSKLVLLDPIGLWSQESPLINWATLPPAALPTLLFKDPNGAAAQAMFALPSEPEHAIALQASLVWAMGCTGKFVWPIPDRGLRKRLHRISIPTLIIWGEDDQLNPLVYANQFGQAIKGSYVEIITQCGHVPQVEQAEATLKLVQEFL